MTAPAGGGEAKPEAPAGPSIDALKAAAAKAEAAAAKAPKDKKLAAAAGKALAELGHAQMMDQSVPPRLRYPQALATLRKAVKVDAKNKAAAADIKAIEDAYKSMGRPVPKS
jgi:tetratricopeptide (TPR) repeat protein